ncbi:MAG: 3-dehydroquinate synthase [Proteobacteria bacterium]|nr:3-dehydroquinate synthase [Pseudomonadota bacterium]
MRQPEFHRLQVELGQRAYPIRIAPGLLDRRDAFAGLRFPQHVLLVTDANVAPLYAERVRRILPGNHEAALLVLPAGEQHKTLAMCARIFSALADMQASRDAIVVALGGGVVGDMAGFAAACWMRGVRCLQIPTTLLAMVDSSVGGKTAVDLPQGKNLVGAFHQPCAVVVDTDLLATLPARELSAGLAEVVKYGALGDAAFFGWIEQHADALVAGDTAVLAQAVHRSCEHKARVVVADETEQGERALLNFGHTFGHALEAEAGYGELLHGEAVAIGMLLAARMSSELGLAPLLDVARLAALLERLRLPIAVPSAIARRLDPSALLARMRLDKKNLSGRLRLVLWRRIGHAFVAEDVDSHHVLELLTDALTDDGG